MERVEIGIVGETNSGKSTLIGHLASLIEEAEKTRIESIEDLNERGKEYRKLISKGNENTVNIQSVKILEEDNKSVYLIDTPGSKRYWKLLNSSIYYSPFVFICVNPVEFIFENSIESKVGRLLDICLSLATLGVERVGVVINKIDEVGFLNSRLNWVKQKTGEVLTKCGFNLDLVPFFMVSALTGQNLTEKYEELEYGVDGKNLLEYIRGIRNEAKNSSAGVKFCINNVYHNKLADGIIIDGKILSGTLKPGETLVSGDGSSGICTSLEYMNQSIREAKPRSSIGIMITNIKPEYLTKGSVLCGEKIKKLYSIGGIANVRILNFESPIAPGSRLEILVNNTRIPVIVIRINCKFEPGTFKKIPTKPYRDFLSNKDIAQVELGFERKCVVGEASEGPELSNFMIRASGKVIGIGSFVRTINEKEDIVSPGLSSSRKDSFSEFKKSIKLKKKKFLGRKTKTLLRRERGDRLLEYEDKTDSEQFLQDEGLEE